MEDDPVAPILDPAQTSLNQQQDSIRPQIMDAPSHHHFPSSPTTEHFPGYGMVGIDAINLSDDGSDFQGVEFEEIHSNQIESKYNNIIEEMTSFKEQLGRRILEFQDCKQKLLRQVENLRDRKNKMAAFISEQEQREQLIQSQQRCLKAQMDDFKKQQTQLENERKMLEAEKESWENEKKRISQIQPLGDIVELNVSGKKEFDIRKSTLCQIKGSALQAMFSGRHEVQMKDDKFFIDRNPKAFGMMIDFIRNSGQLYEEQKNNWEMLKVELQYWGINADCFKQRDDINLIQEILDRQIGDIFDKKEERQFLYENLNKRAKLDVKQLLSENKLKFDENFRIKRVEEIATIEYGINFSQRCIIGKGYQARPNGLFEGELIPLQTGTHELDGYGRFISNRRFEEGEFQVNRLHGLAQRILSNGHVQEGQFQNDVLVEDHR